jgi:UDP-N-acetylmuramate--alanine ligase
VRQREVSLERRGHRPVNLGVGLAPARPSRPIRQGERIHVVGVAGAGASAAALHARAAGAIVSGCDPGGPSPYTPAVEAAGIPIAWRHDPSHVATGRLDRLAVTKALTAIMPDHPELEAARSAGIPVEPWQQLVADAAHGRPLLAVAGTHGKSTTAGWLTWILAEIGLDPAAFVGALLPAALSNGIASTARIGRGAFVVEADEYAGNFDPYRPDVALLTTAEWDHPDVFADRDAVVEAFVGWLRRADRDATIVANLDDPGVIEVIERLEDEHGRSGSVFGVSVEGREDAAAGATSSPLVVDDRLNARILERTPEGTVLELTDGFGSDGQHLRLPTVGDHNASNALVALAAAWDQAGPGASIDRLLLATSSFPGVGRRLERKGEAAGVVVYDDYGHHPTAIRATLQALRQREPARRIWAVYEPLTFHRTAAMLDDFADALAEADAVAVADIWASRDPDTSITSPAKLAAAVRVRRPEMPSVSPGSVEATAMWLAEHVAEGDAVLVMGGGKSYRIADLLLEHLAGDR